jgi:hypothetical protein
MHLKANLVLRDTVSKKKKIILLYFLYIKVKNIYIFKKIYLKRNFCRILKHPLSHLPPTFQGSNWIQMKIMNKVENKSDMLI